MKRLFSVVLIITLLSVNNAMAAPLVVGVAKEFRVSATFWLSSNGWTKFFLFANHSASLPDDKKATIRRIQIFPGSVTVNRNSPVFLNAVAFDESDSPINGVKFNWTSRDVGRSLQTVQMNDTKFDSKVTGSFEIVAEAQGQSASITVTVTNDGPNPTQISTSSKETIRVSSRDSARGESTNNSNKSGTQKGSDDSSNAPEMNMSGEGGWNDSNYWSADDPGNVVGNPLGQPADGGAGSGNFQMAAPVLSLPGRGTDLDLALSYNSRLWNKAGNQLTYDIDRSWPAPGWSLGFGKILNMGQGGSMLVDPDGTRHSYSGMMISGGFFRGHTIDGTFIDYDHDRVTGNATALLANGTKITYTASNGGPEWYYAIYPTRITDANGNYITITYRNNAGPEIETITDTLGRVVTFHYDSLGRLIKINAPKPGSGTRTLVQLHYKQLTLNYSFAGSMTTVVRSSTPWVLDAIYYPATNTGYWFGDVDSYSSYGMIAKVIEQRGMNWASGSEEQGIVTPGQMTKQAVYNYPLGPIGGLTDAPTYTTLTETWEGMDDGPAVTTYDVQQNASPRTVTITQPNGTRSKQYSYNAPNQWNDGLVYTDEVFDSGGNLLSRSTASWEPGKYDSPRPITTQAADERGQTTRADMEYDPNAATNQLVRVRNYDYEGTLLRTTTTTYESSSNYFNRHIYNLPKIVDIYDGAGNRVSRTAYEYDGVPLMNTPGVIMHEESHNPFAPPREYCRWVNDPTDPDCDPGTCQDYPRPPECNGVCNQIWECIPNYNPYNPATDYRGNLTKVTTYTDAANLTGPIEETRRYDITGNTVFDSDEETSYTYTVATQYAYPTSETRGSSDPNSNARVTTSAAYDFNTGLVLQATDANGRVSTNEYDQFTLRPAKTTMPTGAYATYAYDDVAMTVTETVYTVDNVMASKNIKQLNGAGQVKREEALAPNNVWDAVETKYNKLGQVWRQSNPYRVGVETPVWTENFYDAVGRVTRVVEPDGSESKAFYNETTRPDSASNSLGQTIRSVNAWGKERWIRQDAQGRIAEVVEPNPSGNGSVFSAGSLVTKYYYNTLGNLIETEQGTQRRKFAYDSLGRLTKQKLAEQTATLNDAGVYVGAGQAGAQWSEAFVYNNHSNLIQRTDPRGVKTIFSYQVNGNDDLLERLQSIVTDLSGPRDTSIAIASAATVTYEYMTTGDVMRLKKVTAAGVSTEEYAYDVESRVSDYTLTLLSRPNHPFVTSYIYDSLDRVTDVRYPAQYGQLNTPRKVVRHNYDIASRLSGLIVDGQTQASDIVYNASSQTTQLKVGAAGPNQVTESYTYDNQTGLLTNQKVLRGSSSLMDLSYEYLRNGTTSGKTGHLTKLINNLDRNKDRGYEYDALGRLTKAVGGMNATWTQNYNYDRYGNRTSVTTTGVEANIVSTEGSESNKVGPSKSSSKLLQVPSPFFSKQEQTNNYSAASNIVNSSISSPSKYLTDQSKSSDAYQPEMQTTSTRTPFDFDGDGKADISTWTRGSATWNIKRSTDNSIETLQLGSSGDQIVPGDYDGDGKYDKAVWTASSGMWRIKQSSDGVVREQQWGMSGDVPVPGDYDNDGLTDIAIWRGSNGSWWVLRSSDNTFATLTWGSQALGDIVAVGDYNGDGKSDHAVWRPSDGVWYIQNSGGTQSYIQFGMAGDVPVPAKYDGDNKTDIAVWRPSTGTWYILNSTDSSWTTHQLGSDSAGDILVPADYDGDGKADVAVWQPSNGTWTIKESLTGATVTKQLGASGQVAVPSAYIRRSSAPRNQSKEIPRDGLANVSYDTQTNRINSTGWEYDVAGNQTRGLAQDGQTWLRFEYDAANRLVKVKNDAGNTIQSFVYGPTNARFITQDGNEQSNARTYYAWAGSAVISEYVETASLPNTPQWSKSYTFIEDRLLSTSTPNGQSSETIQYHHPDRLGTRLITNASDTSVIEQVTLPFGVALDNESTGATNRRFTSYDRSSVTGLDYAVNRTYDAQQGRFTQIDPIGMQATSLEDPQSLNLYTYCDNDPINHTDADGLFFKKLFKWLKRIFKVIAIVVAVVVAVIAIVAIPGTAAGVLKMLIAIAEAVGAVASAASSILDLLGFSKAAKIFGIIGAWAGVAKGALEFAQAAMDKANRVLWKLIVKGAKVASDALKVLGYSKASQILAIGSDVIDFVGKKKWQKKFKDNKNDNWRRAFNLFKFARTNASRVASIIEAKRFGDFLNFLSVIEDGVGIYDDIDAIRDLKKGISDDDKKKFGKTKGGKPDGQPILSMKWQKVFVTADRIVKIFNKGVSAHKKVDKAVKAYR